MGNTSDFFVDFIIAQNLEKVKFWEGRTNGERDGGSREGKQRKEKENGSWREGRGGEEKGREKQERKIGYVGKGGGVAVWRFQFLPFARKAAPCLTLTFFDFRL